MPLRFFFNRIRELGSLREEPHSFENRRILLLNKVTILAIVICVLIVIVHLVLNNWTQAIVVSSSIFLVSIPTLWLQFANKHTIARYWFLAGFFTIISAVFFHSIRLDLPTGTTYLLIILIPLLIIFLDGISSVITVVAIILCGNFYLTYRYSLTGDFEEKVFYGIHINWVVICVAVLFCVNFFKKTILHANRMIEKDREKLDYANKTKNFLFAVISHDIRSPLNTLKQYLQLDESFRNDPDQFMAYQGELAKKVDEINHTLDDLLVWSKTQLQGMVVNPTVCQPSEVIEEVMTLCKELILKKGIHLSVNSNNTNPLWCDKDHLTVIIRNLIQNAIKFTSSGQELTVTATQENEKIRISIADTGQGMDELTLKNLQEGLIVESYLGTAGEVGTGLGLSLVSEMISKNKGSLEVKSELGTGTKISVLMPVAK